MAETFELSEQAGEWVKLRAAARGVEEAEALEELIELGFSS